MDHRELPLFSDLDEATARDGLARLEQVRVPRGQRLCQAGEFDPMVAIVLEGQLQSSLNGVVLRRVERNGIVGAAALFGDGYRTECVDTLTECSLLLLGLDSYRDLRSTGHRFAVQLEEHVLCGMEAQLRNTYWRVAARPGPLHDRARRPLFDQLTHWFRRMDPRRITDILHRAPLFMGAAPDTMDTLARQVDALSVKAGDPLIEAGALHDAVYFIASGSVQAVRTTGHGPRLVSIVEPGHLLGFGAALARATRAAVTVRAREQTAVLALGKQKWSSLASGSDPLGATLRLAALRSIADQLTTLNRFVAARDLSGPPAKTTPKPVLRRHMSLPAPV